MYTPPPDVNGINSNHINISIDTVQETHKWGAHKIENLTDSPSTEIAFIYQSCQKELDKSFDNLSEKELKQNFTPSPESELIDLTESVFESSVNNPTEEDEDMFGDNSEDIDGDNSNIPVSFDEENQQENLNISKQQVGLEVYKEGVNEEKIGAEIHKEVTEQKEVVSTKTEQVYTKTEQVSTQTQQLHTETVKFYEAEKTNLELLKNLNIGSLLTEGFTEAFEKTGFTLTDSSFIQTEVTKELGPSPKLLLSEEESRALGKKLVVKGLKNKKFRKNGRLPTKNEAKELIASFDQNFKEFYQKKIQPLYLLQQQELKEKKKLEQEESRSPSIALPEMENIKPKEVFVSRLMDEMPYATKMEKILARKLDEASALAQRLKEEKIEREEINYMRLRHEIISKEINHAEINKNDQQQQNFKIDNLSRSKMAEPLKKAAIDMKAKS